jgi:hypothetical protein
MEKLPQREKGNYIAEKRAIYNNPKYIVGSVRK